MKRIILLMVFACLLGHSANAQNKIDQMVETYSTLGSSVFTSAVKRDPKTREVKKVVRVIEVYHPNADNLVRTFLSECKNNRLTTKETVNNNTTIITTEKQSGKVSVYMLEYEQSRVISRAKVTIITNYK